MARGAEPTVRRAKVLVLPLASLLAVLRGEKRVRNLPPDAELAGAVPVGRDLGIRVHSTIYKTVDEGTPIPTAPAVLETVRP